MLTAQNLNLYYGASHALRDVALTAETGKITDLGPGGFIVEALDQWHSGQNPGTEPLKLLVIDQTPAGVKNVELKQ